MMPNNEEIKILSRNKLDTLVKEFTLSLYHNGHFNENWAISKLFLNSKFNEFCMEKNMQLAVQIEALLKEFNFLHKSDESYYFFKYNKIFEYERKLIEMYDRQQIAETKKTKEKTLQTSDDYESLQFEHCIKTERNLNFVANRLSCYICQINFESRRDFKNHVPIHNGSSDFERLRANQCQEKSSFEIVHYQSCQNKSYLRFTIKTKQKNIHIKRILTVKSDYLPTLLREKKLSNCDPDGYFYITFFVDRHIMETDETPQPVVVIYVLDNENDIFIEHYLMSLKPLPKNKYFLSNDKYKLFVLEQYLPPQKLKNLYSGDKIALNDLMMYNPSFREYIESNQKLSKTNISEIFTLLLQMEDIETIKLYARLNQYKASIIGFGYDFSVKVNLPPKTIAEDVLKAGDEILLMPANISFCSRKKEHIYCLITEVNGTTVYFEQKRKSRENHTIDIGKKYTVQFLPNRTNLQYQYCAFRQLANDMLLKALLFPEIQTSKPAANLKLNIVNSNVEKNPEQIEAVMNIVSGVTEVPYIIVGPPGTGKTTTIVESVLQVKLYHKDCRILVTSGSNAACDEVALRLIKLIEDVEPLKHIKMLRIYSKTAEQKSENIESILISSSNLANGYHFYPDLDTIAYYDIVVCTLSVLGRLKRAYMSPTHFSYCFVDECAASTECEALIAVTATFHFRANLILAGDPKQLGPILTSNTAATFGLSLSLMERLLNRECYRVNLFDGSYNRRIQTRLVRNFRTHPDILAVANRLFYKNKLIPSAFEDLTHWATNYCYLPNKQVPIIFHCVDSFTKMDKNSTSLYNPKEIEVVMNYVKKMMYFKKINGRPIEEKDIGIISPYKKQNKIFSEELCKRNWNKISTGAVETFQGQEKPIIIISTVRSVHSEKRGVGFLTSEKRMNVMITRAQALVIFVGNKEILQTVPNWKEALDMFSSKNVIINDEPARKSRVEDLSLSFQNLSINRDDKDKICDKIKSKKCLRKRIRSKSSNINNCREQKSIMN